MQYLMQDITTPPSLYVWCLHIICLETWVQPQLKLFPVWIQTSGPGPAVLPRHGLFVLVEVSNPYSVSIKPWVSYMTSGEACWTVGSAQQYQSLGTSQIWVHALPHALLESVGSIGRIGAMGAHLDHTEPGLLLSVDRGICSLVNYVSIKSCNCLAKFLKGYNTVVDLFACCNPNVHTAFRVFPSIPICLYNSISSYLCGQYSMYWVQLRVLHAHLVPCSTYAQTVPVIWSLNGEWSNSLISASSYHLWFGSIEASAPHPHHQSSDPVHN